MDLRIDDKGKYFTQRVSKDMLPAFIRTASQIVVGNIYTRPDRRLKDELEEDTAKYLAITDARVYDGHSEQLLYHSALMLVACSHIVMISPLDAHEAIRETPWQVTDRAEH
ncbi:MAG: hypothetical protein H7Z42_20755 [Roseiflexaceae bacterium]|nr:hypothetical protein [Roseiflexaceae bacterium]